MIVLLAGNEIPLRAESGAGCLDETAAGAGVQPPNRAEEFWQPIQPRTAVVPLLQQKNL